MRAIIEESDRFLRAIQASEPDARVPTCPDWDSDDLLWHLSEVHAFWAGNLRDRALTDEDCEPVEEVKPERPAHRGATIELMAALDDALRLHLQL